MSPLKRLHSLLTKQDPDLEAKNNLLTQSNAAQQVFESTKVHNPLAQSQPLQPSQAQTAVDDYYVDTIAKVGEMPSIQSSTSTTTTYPYVDEIENVEGNEETAENKGIIEIRYEKLSVVFDSEIMKNNPNFNVLMETILKLFGYQMRIATKEDQERILEFHKKINVQSHEIKDTYNKWHGVGITLVSGGLTGVGGAFGLFASAGSTVGSSISSIGTGVGSFSSLVNNQSEGQRTVMQIYLRRFQDSEQENKDKKQTNKQHIETVRNVADAFLRALHDAFRSVSGTN